MDQLFRDTTSQMEKLGVDVDYVIGWQGGYLGHPKREEQRTNEAYDAGYDHGLQHNTDGYQAWAKQ